MSDKLFAFCLIILLIACSAGVYVTKTTDYGVAFFVMFFILLCARGNGG